MGERPMTTEELAVQDMERRAEQVAAKFDRLAADIRRAVRYGVISAKESSPTDAWNSYSGVAATIVTEVHVALFDMPFNQLIRDGGAADAARAERA